MIEINLLPGAKKKRARSRGMPSLDIGAFFSSLGARFRDPWLGVAIGGVALGAGAVGAMWYFQGQAAAELLAQETRATQDSINYANIVKQTQVAEAQRDSIMKQMKIIAALDGERFVWPHIMDEISRALPTYTWLKSVVQTNTAAAPAPEEVAAGIVPKLQIRLIGLTVDIQALTIFMKQLEASPYLEGVTLAVSAVTVVEGKQLTEFTLDFVYSKPDPSVVKTVPLTIAVR